MKKIISLLFALLITFSVSGCKKEPPPPPASDNISDISLYVDESYAGEDLLLYAIYTVTATDKEIEFFYYTQDNNSSLGSGATATLNGINVYSDLFSANESLSKPFEITDLKSPSEGQVIEAGKSAQFISAFFISKNDLTENGTFTLKLKATHGFNQSEEVSLKVNYVESALSLARTISPDGLTQEEKLLAEEIEEIDKELYGEIDKELEGSWEYSKDGVTTEVTFEKGKYTQLEIIEGKDPKTVAKGNYSIRKKVILITLKDQSTLRIPYTFADGELKLDAIR